jgi:predicted nucleic acid-binding protein
MHLSKLEKLSLLLLLYGNVSIPEYVKNEITNKENDDIRNALSSYLIVHTTAGEKAEEIARLHSIHVGEAHVKALGETMRPCLFLSNERKVRKAAKEEGFEVAGTIGVILRAAKEDKISLREALLHLEQMKSEEFRIHPDLIDEAIGSLRQR